MTPTTAPIRATYSPRPARRIRRRHIIMALTLPPAIMASAGITAAIYAGTQDAMRQRPSSIAPAPHAPAPAPQVCDPDDICFDDSTVDITGADYRDLAAHYSVFNTIRASLKPCHRTKANNIPMPCASPASIKTPYIMISGGRKDRNTHLKPVILVYTDHAVRKAIRTGR